MADAGELHARALRVTPGGVHSPVRAFGRVGGRPFYVRRAEGATLTDTEGHHYLDFCMAFGPLVLGHRPAAVEAAAREALADGWSYGTAEPWSLALAEFVTARVPWAEQVRFVNSGTEAVMTALRLARGATGRAKLLKFAGCYHGHVDGMLIRAGSGLAGDGVADSAGVPPGVAQDTVVAALDDEAGLGRVFATHGDALAAAIVEPLPANHGLLPQRRAFLAALRAHCTRHGALLVFDEVITGFRLGPEGMAGRCGVRPDLVTWGKVLGGGFPVGACAGPRALLRLVAPEGPVYQAGTLSANPVAMRAGLATLQALDDGAVHRQLEELGARLERGAAEAGWRVQREGSIFWIAGRDDGPVVRTPDAVPAALVADYPALFHRLLAEGIYLPPSPFEVGFLSAAHTPADVDRLCAALAAAARG